jgi:hypothetical protein
LRMGFCILATVVVGALMTQPVFAEDAGSSGARDEQRQHSGDDAAGDAAKPDRPVPRDENDKNPGSPLSSPETKTTVPDGKTSDNIDTRNGVLPRRPNPKPNAIGDIKAKPDLPAAKNLHRRVFPPQATPHPAVRNSIAVPIPPREGGERRDAEHPDALGVPQGPVFETPGATGNAAGRFPKTEGHFFDRPAPNTTPIVKPVVPNHAAINGTGVVRRGSGPPQIGGPTTATTGINGTTIRPPH